MKRQILTTIIFTLSALPLLASGSPRTEILRDTSGVPHIYAKTDAQLTFGLAWAQMEDHADLILRAYARSRGRAAEFYGRDLLASDRYVWRMGLPQLAKHQYARLSRRNRDSLDAFAEGMNAYAAHNADKLSDASKKVFPITGKDVLQHVAYSLYYNGLILSEDYVNAVIANNPECQAPAKIDKASSGGASNGWVIDGTRTASGKPILLSNTHFPWPTLKSLEHLLWHEAHLVGPRLDVYGVGLVGVPALTIGFNRNKAWTITAAGAFDLVDFYQLTLSGDGYVLDGATVPFEQRVHRIRILEPDGSMSVEKVVARQSIHGPVICMGTNTALAVRHAISEDIGGDDFLRLARSRNLKEFKDALEHQHLPPLNILYADAEGNLLYSLTGTFPDRSMINYDPGAVLPGDTSANIWYGTVDSKSMPQVENPASGYLQNANEAPWSVTEGAGLDPANFPADFPNPRVLFRAARSLKMIQDQYNSNPELVLKDKFSTESEVANRLLDDLIEAANTQGSPLAQQAAAVLVRWDRRFEADSIGALLFALWIEQLNPGTLAGRPLPDALFSNPYDPADPLNTPNGLANPTAAVAVLEGTAYFMQQNLGSLFVPWGAFLRFQIGDLDLPGFGAPSSLGVFSANVGQPKSPADPRLRTVAGDTWVFIVDFDQPDGAMAVTTYGNATQTGSAHIDDQLPLYASKRLRPVWTTRELIEAHLESRVCLPGSPASRMRSRASEGAAPVQSLKARQNALACEKPSR